MPALILPPDWEGPQHGRSACGNILDGMRRGRWVQRSQLCESQDTPELLRVLCAAPDNHSADGGPTSRAHWLWQPASECAARLFDPDEACAVLQRVAGLQVAGDSFVRHLFLGLLSVVSGDFVTGAAPVTASPLTNQLSPVAFPARTLRNLIWNTSQCSSERMFDDRRCRSWRNLDTRPIKGCAGGSDFLGFHKLDSSGMWPQSIDDVSARFGNRSRVLVVGVALHDHLLAHQVEQFVILPLFRWVRQQPMTSRTCRILLHAHHAVGKLKPDKFRKTQSNEAVLGFNQQLYRIASRPLCVYVLI